jgi:hypothetical protein
MDNVQSEEAAQREDEDVQTALSHLEQMRQTGSALEIWRAEMVAKTATLNQRLGRLDRHVHLTIDVQSQLNASMHERMGQTTQLIESLQGQIATLLSDGRHGDA